MTSPLAAVTAAIAIAVRPRTKPVPVTALGFHETTDNAELFMLEQLHEDATVLDRHRPTAQFYIAIQHIDERSLRRSIRELKRQRYRESAIVPDRMASPEKMRAAVTLQLEALQECRPDIDYTQPTVVTIYEDKNDAMSDELVSYITFGLELK